MTTLAIIAACSVGPIMLVIRERKQRREYRKWKAELAAMVRGEARFNSARQFKEIA